MGTHCRSDISCLSARSRTGVAPIRFGYLTYGLDRQAFGISRAVLNIGRALQRIAGAEPVFLAPYRHGPFTEPATRHIHLPGARLAPGLMTIGAAQLSILARTHALPVIHDPSGIGPFLPLRRPGGYKRVLTLHDATPLQYPEKHTALSRFLYRVYLPAVLSGVDAVITPSHAAARDIMRLLGVSGERIHVVPMAAGPSFRPAAAAAVQPVLDRYRIHQPYVLYVGALEPRKNLPGLLRAFAQVHQQFTDLSLVLAGGQRWQSAGLAELINQLDLSNAVRSTGYVPDEDLPALYSGATVSCFPSFAEGFGLPILEAMACGTPVVCSNVSSMPEVAGEAALQVNPLDPDSMADAVGRVLRDPDLAQLMRARGLERAGQFSWELTAQRTLDIYTTVMAAKS